MEIDVKYNLGESVHIMEENKPKVITVRALRIDCIYNGYSGEYWGDRSAGKGRGWPIIIQYNVDPYGKEKWMNQDLIFKTKEELLKSLL